MAKTIKKEKKRVREGFRTGNHSLNPDRSVGKVKGGGHMRDRSTINRLLMYKNFKPKRNRAGKIIKAAPFQTRLTPGSQARVEPNQRWFGNTKIIGQGALQRFQEELGKVMKDPYQVIMKQTKLPICLLNEKAKHARVHLLDTESFDTTFGPKSTRKRPSLKTDDIAKFVETAVQSADLYDSEKDKDLQREDPGVKDEAREMIMFAGQSKRIWNELYKVIDSSDVIMQVLDARDPMGTRSRHVENFIKKEKPHKHLLFLLNKCDLVPTWVTKKWVAILSQEYPTMAFHASIKNSFGKGALINLLRQFGKLHQDKKQISVGFIGYPNVGKSSVINTLRSKKVCKVAPIAGETKVWQYITLMRRIYLIDCPGVVYPYGETDTDKVLKGVVRVELVKTPEDYIPSVLDRVKKEYLQKTYNLEDWESPEDFLEKLARKSGRLLKGGEPDISTMSKMVLNDWQRGKLPYFVPPPGSESDGVNDESTEEPNSSGHSETTADVTVASLESDGIKNSENGEVDSKENGDTSDDEENDIDAKVEDVQDDEISDLSEEEVDGVNSEEEQGATAVTSNFSDSSECENREETLEKPHVKTSSGVFKVTEMKNLDHSKAVKGPTKSLKGKRKHSNDSSDEPVPKLTAKKRRQMERAEKSKKVGVHFYESANVKNRNRFKKASSSSERGFLGHTKKIAKK